LVQPEDVNGELDLALIVATDDLSRLFRGKVNFIEEFF
jgi:hypothetical protein